ncbi:MAG: aspartate aminotransferase family protein [Candidatus Aenigmatarchaeota archaeon]
MFECLFRDFPPYPIEIASAKDGCLIDKNGKKYLDFMMGWCVGNSGWNKKEILRATKSFKGPVYVSPTYKYQRWEDLAKRLVSLLPKKQGTCFRATGGTEAVEIALKISKSYNRRKKFMAFNDAYHGQSFACMALVGLHENKFGPYPDFYIRLNTADWEKTTDVAVKSIKKGDICAFIAEPIICNLGVIVPPKSFFRSVREACDETDTVLIMDEVATGFGRTGKWFGFEHYDIQPDIITMAKGLSSGYAAIGATVAVPKVAESMRFGFSNYSTFGWHPLSVEVSIANIDYMQKNRLVEKSDNSGRYLMKRLSEFCSPDGKGLCVGFDTGNNKIKRDCRNDGLLIDDFDSRVVLFPALDVSKEQIDRAVGIIKKHYGS